MKAIVAVAFHSAKFVPIDATPSLPVLGFAFGLSLLTGVIFGTAPAWLTSHADPADALRGANRSTRDTSSLSQKILVIVQATLSVVLLAGAGLLTRSLQNLQHQDFGYETDHRVTISLTGPYSTYSQPKLDSMYRELQDRLAHIPGVEARGAGSVHAAAGQLGRDPHSRGPGHAEHERRDRLVLGPRHARLSRDPGPADRPRPRHHRSGHRLATRNCRGGGRDLRAASSTSRAKTPSGRASAWTCRSTAPRTKLSASFAARSTSDAANTRKEPRPIFFVPLAQRVKYDNPMMQMVEDGTHFIEGAVLQLHGSSDGLEPQVRRILSDIDPNLTLLKVQPLQEQVDAEFDQQRAVAQMTGMFGILALILAAVGLYGVTAYSVERRTSEIGVRMALGANRGNVVSLVLRGAFLQILIGLCIGIPISIGCATPDRRSALSREGMGPARARRIDLCSRVVRVDRQHHSGATGGIHQSGEGIANGITVPQNICERKLLDSVHRRLQSITKRC